jgi:predicted ATPase/class 3 adenylate cyclase
MCSTACRASSRPTIIRAVPVQPTGTVTLLFSDIQGSTHLLERLGPARYADALATHRDILRSAFLVHDGYEVDTAGDSFFVAFARAADAVAAAGDAQRGLDSATWPDDMAVRVRMGVHTGEPVAVASGYVGIDVHRAARIMAAAHGGQVVVSGTTQALLDGSTATQLRELGPHRLKDLLAPIPLYQLVVDGQPAEFPPLRSLHRSNLPVAAWPLLGRERELAELRRLVTGGARLVTLTGPGGTGKTRLALQSAADLSDAFPDGVFFVPLAALRVVDAVGPAVAVGIGLNADDDPTDWLRSRKTLIVLDNLEQLRDVARVVATLLVGGTVVLATSRSPVHLTAEHELPIAPLEDDAAVELFVSRAEASGRRIAPDSTVAAICRRVDNLPLAIELAAARTKLLPPAALLQRLDAALPLLAGGAHDLPERQQTLRAAITWSHDLLDEPARVAFRRLSVFRGSFTLEAAEAIADAELDAVAGLVDQSLVVARPDGRFVLLETIRALGLEKLAAAGETRDVELRHARSFLLELEARDPLFRTSRVAEARDWYLTEEENLRTMLDRMIQLAPAEAARAGYLLGRYQLRWGSSQEARRRLEILRTDDRLDDAQRALVLVRLATLGDRLGDWREAAALAHHAEALTSNGRDPAIHVDALGWLVVFSSRAGDHEAAVGYARRSLAEAEQHLDRPTYLQARYDLGAALGSAGEIDEARGILREVVVETHTIGDVGSEAFAAFNLGELELRTGNFEEAAGIFEQASIANEQLADVGLATWARIGRGLALACLHRRADARVVMFEALELLIGSVEPLASDLGAAADVMALACDPQDAPRAARLRGAASRYVVPGSGQVEEMLAPHADRLEQPLIAAIGRAAWAEEREAGRSWSLDEAIEIARSLARSR